MVVGYVCRVAQKAENTVKGVTDVKKARPGNIKRSNRGETKEGSLTGENFNRARNKATNKTPEGPIEGRERGAKDFLDSLLFLGLLNGLIIVVNARGILKVM